MPRIRTIKPSLFTHADLFDAEQETGLPLRLAYAGIWTCCDREGRFKWRPREMKIAVLPYDELDFSRVLDALETRGYLVKYEVGKEVYGYVPSWKKHQFINNKEAASELPEPVSNQSFDASTTRESPVNYEMETCGVKEGKGKEWNGMEGESEAAPILITHHMVAKEVCSRLKITHDEVFRQVAEQAKLEIGVGCEPDQADTLIDQMVKAWETYKANLQKLWGTRQPKDFFSEGMWRDQSTWPWKETKSSARPTATTAQAEFASKYANAEEDAA